MRYLGLLVLLLSMNVHAQTAPPTIAQAQEFMNKAEAQLAELSVKVSRTTWVQENSNVNNNIQMGRKTGISRSERLLRAEIARALAAAIGGKRGAQSSAAEQLGISRQAMSLYIQQKATPSSKNLRRMCQILKLSLNVEGASLDFSSFAKKAPIKTPVQTSLFDALSDVGDQQLDVKVLRKRAQSLDLQVTIDFHPTSKKA